MIEWSSKFQYKKRTGNWDIEFDVAMSRNRISSMSQQKELRRIENESHIQTNDFLSLYSVNIGT